MQIQVNTDKSTDGHAEPVQQIEDTLTAALDHYAVQIARLEVRLSDANRDKAGQRDKRCLLEGRLAGQPPLVVTHEAGEVDLAVSSAADKPGQAISHQLSKLAAH